MVRGAILGCSFPQASESISSLPRMVTGFRLAVIVVADIRAAFVWRGNAKPPEAELGITSPLGGNAFVRAQLDAGRNKQLRLLQVLPALFVTVALTTQRLRLHCQPTRPKTPQVHATGLNAAPCPGASPNSTALKHFCAAASGSGIPCPRFAQMDADVRALPQRCT